MLRSILFVLSALLTISVVAAQPKTIRVPQDQATIQGAIDASVNGDTVLVAEGTYSVNLLLTKKIVLGSLFLLDQDTSHISKTILDGGTPRHADSASIILIQGEADSTTHIIGFTFRNGGGTRIYAPISPTASWTYRTGGAIQILAAGARISHNVFRNNSCTAPLTATNVANDPAISIWGDVNWTVGPRFWIIEHNVIMDNQATGYGVEGCGVGFSGRGRMVNNIVMNNRANGLSYSQGSVVVWGSPGVQDIIITGNLIKSNLGSLGAAVSVFAGLYGTTLFSPQVTLANNIITGNGAGSQYTMYFVTGNFRFVNNTILNNTSIYTVGLSNDRGSIVASFLNNIIWNPATTNEFSNGGLAAGSYNLVRTGFAGTGNITGDPLFMSTHQDSIGWFRFNSPAANAGITQSIVNSILLTAPSHDYYGHPRYGSAPDIGAFEDGPWSAAEDMVSETPYDFALEQNYPNPFNPETRIGYRMKERGSVEVSVMNILGQRVAVLVDGVKEAGYHEVVFGRQSGVERLPSGIYFYRMSVRSESGERLVSVRKMVLMK